MLAVDRGELLIGLPPLNTNGFVETIACRTMSMAWRPLEFPGSISQDPASRLQRTLWLGGSERPCPGNNRVSFGETGNLILSRNNPQMSKIRPQLPQNPYFKIIDIDSLSTLFGRDYILSRASKMGSPEIKQINWTPLAHSSRCMR